MTSAESAMLTQPQVAAEDYVELSRLVIEAAWRVDIGRADTLHELFTTTACSTWATTIGGALVATSPGRMSARFPPGPPGPPGTFPGEPVVSGGAPIVVFVRGRGGG